jgi:hypothetical protein
MHPCERGVVLDELRVEQEEVDGNEDAGDSAGDFQGEYNHSGGAVEVHVEDAVFGDGEEGEVLWEEERSEEEGGEGKQGDDLAGVPGVFEAAE